MNKQKKIMLFDDENDILEICKFVFEKKGYIMITKNSCEDIVKDVSEHNPDLIIMDNWIPTLGGVEAIQTLKNNPEFSHIPVIFFSANKDIKSLTEEAKADAYIEKPFDLKEMEEKVQSLIGS